MASKRVWKKIVAAVAIGVLAIGLFIYFERFNIAVLYLEGNAEAHEWLILHMVEYAKPAVQTEFKMTIFEKIFSALAGKRSLRERQADALKDVRAFCQLSFKAHRLRFMSVHGRDALGDFALRGFDFALAWNAGKGDEVLMAFSANLLKRVVGASQLNENCSFFADLRAYVEKRVKEN